MSRSFTDVLNDRNSSKIGLVDSMRQELGKRKEGNARHDEVVVLYIPRRRREIRFRNASSLHVPIEWSAPFVPFIDSDAGRSAW
jgi:hypothetical protein